jgi:hypothetical protein
MGLSTFVPYTVANFPRLIMNFADALGIERFAVAPVSGGGRYALRLRVAVAKPSDRRRVDIVDMFGRQIGDGGD